MKSTRNTIQKQIVYNAACALAHPSADAVYSFVCAEHPKISRATVFRVLNGLSEAGKLRHIYVPGSADRFDSTLSEHSHIRCVRCNRIDDVNARASITAFRNGYTDIKYTLLFEGICPDCAGKGK